MFVVSSIFIACIPHLHTLTMSHCRLKNAADIEHLLDCEELGVVDLSHNKLDDPEIISIFSKMKSLVSIPVNIA